MCYSKDGDVHFVTVATNTKHAHTLNIWLCLQMVSSSRHEFTSNVRLSSLWSVCWLILQRSCSNIFLSISMRLLFNIKYSKNADAQISSYRSNRSNVEKGRNRKLFYQTDSICSALFIVHRKLWINAYWISKANFWDARFSRLQFRDLTNHRISKGPFMRWNHFMRHATQNTLIFRDLLQIYRSIPQDRTRKTWGCVLLMISLLSIDSSPPQYCPWQSV